jgi:hypothetical protein
MPDKILLRRPVTWLVLCLAIFQCEGVLGRAQAAAHRKAHPASPPAPPIVLPEPPLPTQKAKLLGLTQCIGAIDKMSRDVLNKDYNIQSGWDRQNPTQHTFQSVAILNNPRAKPADGLAAIVATPTPNGACDGVTLQVFPLAGSCARALTILKGPTGKAIPLKDARIVFDSNGRRFFLLPGFADTCIAVAVDSTFGEARQK